MITVNDRFRIPNKWEELSSAQFCNVCEALYLFEEGTIDFVEFKLLVINALLEIDHKKKNEIYCENLFRIGEHITFPYKFVYRDSKFNSFPEEIQQYLTKHLPADLQDPYQRLASKMDVCIESDLYFSRQMLPQIKGKLNGYAFAVTGEVVNTSLNAGQYINANTMLQQFCSTGNKIFLQQLVKILYCISYTAEKAEKISLKGIEEKELYAVMYNYQGIANWISSLAKYDILFNAPSREEGKNLLGPNAPLYTLAGKGYGSIGEMETMPLFSYLDLLLKQTVDAVLQLKSLDKKKTEIAAELNLTIDQINTIL